MTELADFADFIAHADVRSFLGYPIEIILGLLKQRAQLLCVCEVSQAVGQPVRTLEEKESMIFLDCGFFTLGCPRSFPLRIFDNLILSGEKKHFHERSGVFQKSFLNEAKST